MPTYEFQIGGRTFEVQADRMPSAAQMRSIASRMGGGERRPARPEDFTPSTAPQGSAVGRFARGAWDMVNPIAMVEGVASAVRHPIDTAAGIVGAQVDQGRKALEAAREGRYSEAAGYGAAALLPVVGPVAAGIGEEIGRGDVAGGLGKAAGLLGPMVAARPAAAAAQKGATRAREAVRAALAPADEVSDAARWALEQGVPVDVATVSGNRVVRAAKAAADSSLGGALPGTKAARLRQESMARLGRDLAKKAAPDAATPETAGAGVRGAVENVIRKEAATADDAYARVRRAEANAMPDDVPVDRRVASGRSVDQGFIGHWLADDLNEMGYQAGGRTKKGYDIAAQEWMPGDSDAARYGIGVGSGRVAGTPTQEMFHAAGVSGSRAEIAEKVRRYLRGESNNPRIGALIDAMGEAWDGQRFDFQLLTDDTLARTGLKRSDFKSPVTMPSLEAPGASKFFGDQAEGLAASGTEPMQLAVPLAGARDALRPIYDRLRRKKELTGNLMGDDGRAIAALDALISGPEYAPLSVVDAALGDLKAAARGAAMPELRTGGQGVAAQAVKELETVVQQRAKAAGVWDDLRLGRDATIAKWTAAETLDNLRAEPVQTFRMLTQAGDAAIDRLRAVEKAAPHELPKIGRAFLDDLLDTATAEGGFGKEARIWSDWQRLGDQTKAALFPDRELRTSLDRFFLVGKKMAENPNPSGSALVAQIPGQIALTFVDPVSSAATVVAGGAISKALNSPRLAKLLTEAMQTPANAPAARSLAARLRVALQATPAAAALGQETGRANRPGMPATSTR